MTPHLLYHIGGGRSPANTHEGVNLNFNHEKLQTSTRMNIQVRNAVVASNPTLDAHVAIQETQNRAASQSISPDLSTRIAHTGHTKP